MRRADRLFQIIQTLRTHEVVTAAQLAAEFEVSERTIYRDIQDLMTSGVGIDGEAGVGYTLRAGFDLPPLMFTAGEIEALVLGARMVEAMADPALGREARRALAKAESVLPDALRDTLRHVPLLVPDFHLPQGRTDHLQPLRQAIASRRKVRFAYVAKDQQATERTVRPLALAFWNTAWTAVGWCELRDDFRSFRTDRISGLEMLEEVFADEPGRDLGTFLRRVDGAGNAPDST